MKLQQRDKRALIGLALAAVGVIVFRLVSDSGAQPAVVGASASIPAAERRLERVRQLAATVDGKQQLLKQVTGELAEREKGIIQAETGAQAQAQLLGVVRRVAQAQKPPLEFGSVELQQPSKFGDYGQVSIAVPFTCRIDELLNFLADLTNVPEAVSTTELRVTSADAKQKTISVRLTVSGVVPRRLVPEKKGLAAF